MTLGERVRQLREARGMTVRQLSMRIGVSHSSLTRIELGATRSLVTETLISLAEALGVSMDFLVHGQEVAPIANPPAKSPVDYYPFPAYSVKGGVIVDVNMEMLELTGWPKEELLGMPTRLARFRYPYIMERESDLLITYHGHIHVHHRITPARMSHDLDVHMVHVCTPESIAETKALFSHMMHERWGMENLPAALRAAIAQMRRFGMRGVSVWFTDPVTGEGMANLFGNHTVNPHVTNWQLQQLRQAVELGEPCEYLMPVLDEQLLPEPLGYPRRAMSIPLDKGVLTFGWAGELTLAGFEELASGIAWRISVMLER